MASSVASVRMRDAPCGRKTSLVRAFAWRVFLAACTAGSASAAGGNTATVTLTETVSLTPYSLTRSSSGSLTDSFTLTSSDEQFTHLLVDTSGDLNTVRAGDEVRLRVATVVQDDVDIRYLNAINTTKGDGTVLTLNVYEIEDTTTPTCSSLASSDRTPTFTSGVLAPPTGSSRELANAAHFTFYAPAVPFTICVKYSDADFTFSDLGTWLMLQRNRKNTLTSATPSGAWYFLPLPARVRMYPVVNPTAGDNAVLRLVADGSFSHFTTSNTGCNASSTSPYCSSGDSVKMVPRYTPCTTESVGGAAYVGANMVTAAGAWTTTGLSRYHEGIKEGGSLGKVGSGNNPPFSVAITESRLVADAVAYLQFPTAPGEYDVCYSPQKYRALQNLAMANATAAETNVTLSPNIEALPVWVKVYACDTDFSCSTILNHSYIDVLNNTMTWAMYDLTPSSWGIIQFTGDNLRRLRSSAAHTLSPEGDAFRIVPNPAQAGLALVASGCFTTRNMTVTGPGFEGSVLLGGDPTDSSDVSLASNTTFGTAYVPSHGSYVVCYRKWDERGKWRTALFASALHPVLGALNYSSNLLIPGSGYDNVLPSMDATHRAPILWEASLNDTLAETESPISLRSLHGRRLDARPWRGYQGTAVRVVPVSTGCAGSEADESLSQHLSAESLDGGEPECTLEELDAGQACPGRYADGLLLSLDFAVRMPRLRFSSLVTMRVCARVGWMNWLAPPRADSTATAPAPSSALSGTLTLREKRDVLLRTAVQLEGVEVGFFFTDSQGRLSTGDQVRIITTFRPFEVGEMVDVTGPPVSGQTDWFAGHSLAGLKGLIVSQEVTGYKLGFLDPQGGWMNAIYAPSSLRQTFEECSLSRKTYAVSLVDSALQPYCERNGSGTVDTAGLLQPPCNVQRFARDVCAPHPATSAACGASERMRDFLRITPDTLDDVVPLGAFADGLNGVAAVIRFPPVSINVLSLCYRHRNAGWLRVETNTTGWKDGAHFNSLPLKYDVQPPPGTRLLCSKLVQFTLNPSISFHYIRAKVVKRIDGTHNDNCLQPPAGTSTDFAASAVSSNSHAFSMLMPEEDGDYWFCFQFVFSTVQPLASWVRIGPYPLQATGVSWETVGELANMGTANILLGRTRGLFNISPGEDKAKLVAANDTCHATGVAGIGPRLSTPVQQLVTDLGPADGLSSDALFTTTLPSVQGDGSATYRLCVFTYFLQTNEKAWVEVGRKQPGKFTTRGSHITGWSLHEALRPHDALGLHAQEAALAGASTDLGGGRHGFVVSFSKRIFDDLTFKMVKVGGPNTREPPHSNGTGWDWVLNADEQRGCDPLGTHGTTPSDLCTGSDCVHGMYIAGNTKHRLTLTLPDVGMYYVCLKMGNGSWMRVPSQAGADYLYTVPTFVGYEKEGSLNLTVMDKRVDSRLTSLASWCKGTSCGDRMRFAGWSDVCTYPDWSRPGSQDVWFNLSSYAFRAEATAVALANDATQLNTFNFPPPNFHSKVVKLCVFKSEDYGTVLTASGANASTVNASAFVTKRGVVYTLWNYGQPDEGGGSFYWRPANTGDSLLVSSPAYDLTKVLTLRNGELLELTVQAAFGEAPVILPGVVTMVLCTDLTCNAVTTDRPYVVSNVDGCVGNTALTYRWEDWGRRQLLNELGLATFRYTLNSNCPSFGCLVRFYAEFGTKQAWSPTIMVAPPPYEDPDGVTVNNKEVPTCPAITSTCNVTIQCFHLEECPLEIAARKQGPRVYAAVGRITLSHALLGRNVSTMGFGNPKTKQWNNKGLVTFVLNPILRDGINSYNVELDIELPLVATKIVILLRRRIPTQLLLHGAVPLDGVKGEHYFRTRRRVPVSPWLAQVARSVPLAAPSSSLVAAAGSYLQVDVPYQLRLSVLSDDNKNMFRPSWVVGLRSAADPTLENPTRLTDLAGQPLLLSSPRVPENATYMVIEFLVHGGAGCSRLNTNRPTAGTAIGQGCDFVVELTDESMGVTLSATLRTPVRVPATYLRIVLPGDDMFNVSKTTYGQVSAPVQQGIPVTAIPGSLVRGVFMNDEFHYGDIFAFFGPSGLQSGDGAALVGSNGGLVTPTHAPVTLTGTTGGSLRGIWGAQWTLKVTQPCQACRFSFHSEYGASPQGRDSYLDARFYDDTSQLACKIDTAKGEWRSDRYESTVFTVTVQPLNSANVNTQWPTAWVELRDSGVFAMKDRGAPLQVVHGTTGPPVVTTPAKMMRVQMKPDAAGNAVATFSMVAYGMPPPARTLFRAVFATDLGTSGGRTFSCATTAVIDPLLVQPEVSLMVTSVAGAQPLCPPCTAKPCNCTMWLADLQQAEKLDFHVEFWETHADGLRRHVDNYNISAKVGPRFPHWVCSAVGPEKRCVSSENYTLSTTYANEAGEDGAGTRVVYSYGSYGAVMFAKRSTQFHSAPLGKGIVSLVSDSPTPARDVSFEICAVFAPHFLQSEESVAPPGCITVRLWAAPAAPTVSVGLLRLDKTRAAALSPNDPLLLRLNTGGVLRSARMNAGRVTEVCGADPSALRAVAVLWYEGSGGVRYIAYDRPASVSVRHDHPATLLASEAPPGPTGVATVTAHSTLQAAESLSARFTHSHTPLVGVRFTFLKVGDAAAHPLVISATSPGLDVGSYTTAMRMSALHAEPPRYTSLRVLDQVTDAVDCPSTQTAACVVNNYISRCPDPGVGFAFSPTIAGLPFPVQLAVENDNARRSWSYPASVALVESLYATTGCGYGGVFSLLTPRTDVRHISGLSSFVPTEATAVTNGVGVAWPMFSLPCEACVLRVTLCDPGAHRRSDCAVLTPQPKGPPLSERVRVTKTFSVLPAAPTAVAVKTQTHPPTLATASDGQKDITIGSVFTLQLAAVTRYGGAGARWAFEASEALGGDVPAFTAEVVAKWIDNSVVTGSEARYGNGGFLSSFAGTVGSCTVSKDSFDAAGLRSIDASNGRLAAFTFTRTCSRCEVWVVYSFTGGITQWFALRHSETDSKATQFRVRSCGTKWLLAGTPMPSVSRRRPFSLTAWRVDDNNMPAWDEGRSADAAVVLPRTGYGGNGGGGAWHVLSPTTALNATHATARAVRGVAVVKLLSERACYACTVEFARQRHTVAVLTDATKLVVIPHATASLEQACCSNASTYRFTVFATDNVGDRSYLVGGATPLPWHASAPLITPATLSVVVPPIPRLIPWRTDLTREEPQVRITGSCMVNGLPQGALCGEGGEPGEVEIEVHGGPLTNFPIHFALSTGAAVETSLWGNQPAPRVTRAIEPTELEVDSRSPVKVPTGAVVDVPMYLVGTLTATAEGAQDQHYVAAKGTPKALVLFNCSACHGCRIANEVVTFRHGEALLSVELEDDEDGGTVAQYGGSCTAVVKLDLAHIKPKELTFVVDLTPRYTWVYRSTSTLNMSEPPNSIVKSASSRVGKPVTVRLAAYTRYYERSERGGFVRWNATNATTLVVASITRRGLPCFTTTAVELHPSGTVVEVEGWFYTLPCTLRGLVSTVTWQSALPTSTGIYNVLEVNETEPVALVLLPYEGLVPAAELGGTPSVIAGLPVTVTVQAIHAAGAVAEGDYFTRVLLRLTREGIAKEYVETVRSGVAVFSVVLANATFHAGLGQESPWRVEVRPHNGTSTVTPATSLGPLYCFLRTARIAVEFRGLPLLGLPEEQWRPLGGETEASWMSGYALQLRLVAQDNVEPPNIVGEQNRLVTVDAADLPCGASDRNVSWLATTCLPPLHGDQSWRDAYGGAAAECTSTYIPPCGRSTWFACPLAPDLGDRVELLSADFGVVEGRLIGGGADMAVVETSFQGVTLQVPRQYVHHAGCLTGAYLDDESASVAHLRDGRAVVGSLRYDRPVTGDVYFRVVTEGLGVAYVKLRMHYVASLTFAGVTCAGGVDGAGTVCPLPVEGGVVYAQQSYRLLLTINDEAGDTVRSENYSKIEVSGVCESGEPGFRLGMLGGVSQEQVTSPVGWNVSQARNGVVEFNRLAFRGPCARATLSFVCFGHSPDLDDACASLNMTTLPFVLLDAPPDSGGTPPTLPPAQNVSQPTLVVDMGDLDSFLFSNEERFALAGVLIASLRQKSRFPDDLKQCVILNVCTLPKVRAAEGLTLQDRTDAATCKQYKAGVLSTDAPPVVDTPSPGNETDRDASVLGGEDCGWEGCTTLVEFQIVVLNPYDPVLAGDVFAAFKLAAEDPNSPLRKAYAINPVTALVSTAYPPLPATAPPTPLPTLPTPLPTSSQEHLISFPSRASSQQPTWICSFTLACLVIVVFV